MTLESIPWSKGAGLSGDVDDSPARCAAADERAAFARVVAEQQPYVARLAQRLLGWDPEVEDVVQDVFATAWQRRAQLRDAAKLRGWLSAITVNTVRARLRRRKLRRAWLKKDGPERVHGPNTSDKVGASIERDETSRQVRQAVNRLPQKEKEVLVLRYLEHMSVHEVAEALGLKVNAVYVRLHRARTQLARQLPRELQR